jgi:hypothetical protein
MLRTQLLLVESTLLRSTYAMPPSMRLKRILLLYIVPILGSLDTMGTGIPGCGIWVDPHPVDQEYSIL